MGMGELLDRIRDQYLGQFTAAVKKLRRRRGVDVRSEVVLVGADGKPVGEGKLLLPLRLDLVVVSNGEVTGKWSVDSDRRLQFEPITFAWGDKLRVTLRPFPWDALTIRFPKPRGRSTWRPLARWFREWFREDEDGTGEPLGVVHFLSDPEVADGRVRFTTDLGTAPVETFEGLLDAVAELGVGSVTVGGEG
jgi:hypothetical protein